MELPSEIEKQIPAVVGKVKEVLNNIIE